MNGAMLGFIIWAAVGAVISFMGVRGIFSEKPIGFWANIEQFEVKDVEGYNKATGALLFFYGIVFILLGLPLLAGQNSPYILLSIIGVAMETIVMMAIYFLVITKKYKV